MKTIYLLKKNEKNVKYEYQIIKIVIIIIIFEKVYNLNEIQQLTDKLNPTFIQCMSTDQRKNPR